MYFKSFPVIKYPIENSLVLLQDITRRVVLSDKIDDLSFAERYLIRDGDTPDMLAHRFYQDSTLYWVLMLVNEKMSLSDDWPLTAPQLQAMVIKETGSLEAALSVRHYVDSRSLIVPDSFPGLKFPVTFLEHETMINDSKRPLKVPRREVVDKIISDVESMVRR